MRDEDAPERSLTFAQRTSRPICHKACRASTMPGDERDDDHRVEHGICEKRRDDALLQESHGDPAEDQEDDDAPEIGSRAAQRGDGRGQRRRGPGIDH